MTWFVLAQFTFNKVNNSVHYCFLFNLGNHLKTFNISNFEKVQTIEKKTKKDVCNILQILTNYCKSPVVQL